MNSSKTHLAVARRYRHLSAEIKELDEQLDGLVAQVAAALVAVEGVSTETATSLLIAAGENPERLTSEAAFAHFLRGAAPTHIDADFGALTGIGA